MNRLDEEMIKSLFGCTTSNMVKSEGAKCSITAPPKQQQRILDPRKSQNIAILLRALTVKSIRKSGQQQNTILDGESEKTI